jgi:hypothetical protein
MKRMSITDPLCMPHHGGTVPERRVPSVPQERQHTHSTGESPVAGETTDPSQISET